MNPLFPADPRHRSRRDLVLALLLLLAGAALVHRATRKECGVLVRNQHFGAQFLARAADPYAVAAGTHHYRPGWGPRIHGPYPPTLALMAAPLSQVPTPAARILWASLQVGALWLLFFIGRGWCRRWWPRAAPHAPVLYAGALLLVSRYLLRDMAGGGGNLLYATLATVGIDLHLRGRRWWAGLPLGLGLVLKPNLCLVLLPFLLQRKWRTLGATAAAAAGLWLLAGLYYGLGDFLAITLRWAREALAYAALQDLHDHGLIREGWVKAKEAMNQSLREAVHRLLRPPGDTGAHPVNPVTLAPAAASWVARGLSLLLLLAAARLARRRLDRAGFLLQALAMLPLCLLLSPITWKAHHTALLPLFFLLLALLAEHRGRPRWLALLLALYYPLCNLLNQEILGKEGKNLLQALSLVTWAGLALFLAALALGWRKNRLPPGNHPPPRA